MKRTNERRETVAEMYGEYKICARFLTMQNFIDLYPWVSNEELGALRIMLDVEDMERIRKYAIAKVEGV